MKRAFTLLEVLIVILIVAIVAAALFPVFFKAKARAKEVVCISNMRQVYLGIMLYEQDFDDLPTAQSDNAWWWQRYTAGTQLKCPNLAKKRNSIDYFVTAGAFTSTLPADSRLGREWRECRELRGTTYPYAFDPNHYSTIDGYQGLGRKVILVRASGQIVSVPFRPYGPWPCAKDLFVEVQH